MVLGVATGIIVCELLLIFPVFNLPLRIAIITFFASVATLSFGPAPVIPIKAAVSAILVTAFGPATAGPTRLKDVAIGAAIGLLFSQILSTPDQ